MFAADRAFLVCLICAISWVGGCYRERPTQVGLEGRGVSVFVLSGSGNLSEFSVYVVSPSDLSIGKTVESLSTEALFTQPAVWRIENQADIFHARTVENIGRLTFALVPQGYKQTIPANGSAPSILPGKQYFFDCVTVNAPGSRGSFQLVDDRVVRSEINLPCLQARNGKQVTVPCNAH